MLKLSAGLIGSHIQKTRLPAALKIMCDAAGWNLDFHLIDTAKRPDFDFAARLSRAKFEGWRGMTITHPWKSDARTYVGPGMQTETAHLGSANTILFGPPDRGFNTDYTGFLSAFRAFNHTPGRVVMMGAGGVAQALAPALIKLGATELTICDLALPKAQDLANNCGARLITPEQAPDSIAAADGLVNATPLGMTDYPGTAFDPAWLGPQTWAFDAVYTPTDTMFLRDANLAGLACLTGFDLFKAMAIRTFEAYTGVEVDQTAILPTLDALRPTDRRP